jgi:hypothetical protein
VGYLHVRRLLVKVSPTGHVFVNEAEERKWCANIFDIQANSLAVELFQVMTHATTIAVHKDVLLGLVSMINKQHKGREKPTMG